MFITKSIIQYFLIILMIITHGALFYAVEVMSLIPQIITIIIAFVAMKWRIKKCHFVLFLFIAASVAFTALISGGIGPKLIVDLLSSFFIVEAAYIYDPDMFLTRIVNIITFIASCSLVGFLIWNIQPDIIKAIFIYDSNIYGGFYNGYIYVVKLLEPRNVGIFYEPGVMGTVLLMQLFYILFYSDKLYIARKKVIYSVIITVIAIITTFSLMAYIGTVIVALAFALSRLKTEEQKRVRKYILVFSVLITTFIFNDYITNRDNSIWNVYVVEKIDGINSVENANNHVTSGGARIRTAEISLQMLFENPFGSGYNKFSEAEQGLYGGTVTGGNILFKHLGTAGIITYLLTLYMVFGEYYRYSKSKYVFWVFVILYVNITLAQSQMWYPLFFVAKYLEQDNVKEIDA